MVLCSFIINTVCNDFSNVLTYTDRFRSQFPWNNSFMEKEIAVKPLKQSEFHKYIYLAYDKTRKPSYLAEKVIQYAKTHAIQEEK